MIAMADTRAFSRSFEEDVFSLLRMSQIEKYISFRLALIAVTKMDALRM
jgi:hypothetical protein